MATAGSSAATTISDCPTYSKTTVAQSSAPPMQAPWPQLCVRVRKTSAHFLGSFCFLSGCGEPGKPGWLSLCLLEGRKVTYFFHLLTEMQQLLTFTKLPLTLMMF